MIWEITAQLNGGAIDFTVLEDIDGDGDFENQQTKSLSSGTNTYNFDQIAGQTGNDVTWFWDATGSETDTQTVTSVKAVTALTLTASKTAGVGGPVTSDLEVGSNIPAVKTTGIGSPAQSALSIGVDVIANKATAVGDALTSFILTENWMVDGGEMFEVVNERSRWDTLSLTLRASEAHVDNVLSQFGRHSGDVSMFTDSEGVLRGKDRARGQNTFRLTPPAARYPPRKVGDYHVLAYQKRQVDQNSSQYEVTVEFLRNRSKTLKNSYDSETPGTDEWHFSFSNGAIATRRVKADIQSETTDQVGSVSFNVPMTNEQAEIFEEHASKQDSVRIRSVPDGDSIVEDVSSDTRNAVYIVPPQSGGVDEGSYRITDWESSWISDDFVEIAFSVSPVETGDKAAGNGGGKKASLN